MRISEVMLGVSITKQPMQYESIKVEARVTAAATDDGDITEDDREELQAQLRGLLTDAYDTTIADFWKKHK